MSAVAEHPIDDTTVLLRTDVPDGGVAAVNQVLAGVVDQSAVRVTEVLDDGLDAWRDHAQIVEVGRRLLIRPPWLPWEGPAGAVADEFVVVELDPGRSWGRGAHPTTRLCLDEIERLVDRALALGRRELTVVDVGCGSGSLSIAAALLGATRVEAFDLDRAAVEATEANAARNGVADRVHVHLVPAEQAQSPLGSLVEPADLIVANIGAAALIELAPHLLAHLAAEGTLVLSGLLDPAPPEVAAAYSPRPGATTTLDGWSAITL